LVLASKTQLLLVLPVCVRCPWTRRRYGEKREVFV
jgi:hypothetical protein